MKTNIIIEQVIEKKPTLFGNSSHIILPKRFLNRQVYVLVIAPPFRKPYIHYGRVKEKDGKKYYQAEISDSAGTHSFWVEKRQARKIFTRNNEED